MDAERLAPVARTEEEEDEDDSSGSLDSSSSSSSSSDFDETDAIIIDRDANYPVRTSTSTDEYVWFLVEQIRDEANAKKPNRKRRQQLEFYYMVQGGNVTVVRSVFEHMVNNHMFRELKWATGASDDHLTWLISNSSPQANYKSSDQKRDISWLRWFVNIFCYLVMSVVALITTPFFYFIHAIVHDSYEAFRMRIVYSIDLPFFFAVLSEKPEMVQLFMEYGSTSITRDRDGNNVYHYLADLSIEKPKKAIRCHQLIQSCIQDIRLLRNSLMEDTNYLELTGLEAIAKYGSLHYFHHILEAHGCIGRKRFEVWDEGVWTATQRNIFNISQKRNAFPNAQSPVKKVSQPHNSSDEPNIQIWEFDMKKYEQGDVFGKQSYLLHLLTGRSVDLLPKADATVLLKSRIIRKCMQVKRYLYAVPCIMSHVYNVVISILFLIYILLNGGNMQLYPLANMFHDKFLEYAVANMSIAYNRTIDDMRSACGGSFTNEQIWALVFGPDFSSEGYLASARLERGLMIAIMVLLSIQLFIDISVRQVFVFRTFNFNADCLSCSVIPVVYRWIPGSYAEKQLSVIMCIPYFFTIYIAYMKSSRGYNFQSILTDYVRQNTLSFNQTETVQLLNDLETGMRGVQNLEKMLSVIYMTCLLVRFFHTIHAFRLLPGIGFFILTTKKMARHLFQFGLVFIIVLIAFAAMFYLGIRDEKCPALQNNLFDTVLDSMFATYQLALSHGEVDLYSSNLFTKIAYMICTIVTIVMLLNLIIAVMTTTATDMNAMPWRQAVCLVEMWDEILGVEAQFLTMTSLGRMLTSMVNCSSIRSKTACKNLRRNRRKCKSYMVVYYNNEESE